MLDEWTARLCAELGVELDLDVRLLLDVARDAAHEVTRTAAPVTTFVVGYAAAARGGGTVAIAEAAARASALAHAWAAEHPSTDPD